MKSTKNSFFNFLGTKLTPNTKLSTQNSFYTSQFWLLCISNFLFSASFSMMIPELPSYLANMGGKQQIGLIIALFTLTAGVSRPFSGKLTDTVGRIPVMAFGSIVCFICGFFYPFVLGINSFLFLRFIHGFSTGTKPTATSAYVADIIPENKRGEAAGMLGIFTATGMSISPTMGSEIATHFGVNAMFYVSSAFALLSILILVNMDETLPKADRKPFSLSLLKINRTDIFEKRVLPVFWVMLCVSFGSGAILTLVPDQTLLLGIKNKGLFFTIYTLASLLVRVFFAKSSDNYGRVPILKISGFIMVISMIILGLAQTFWVLTIAAILFGFSWGINTPTLTAWTIDLSHPDHRGKAMGTMFIALEAGIGLGAYISGIIYQGNVQNIKFAYFLAAFFCLISLLTLFNYQPKTYPILKKD